MRVFYRNQLKIISNPGWHNLNYIHLLHEEAAVIYKDLVLKYTNVVKAGVCDDEKLINIAAHDLGNMGHKELEWKIIVPADIVNLPVGYKFSITNGVIEVNFVICGGNDSKYAKALNQPKENGLSVVDNALETIYFYCIGEIRLWLRDAN